MTYEDCEKAEICAITGRVSAVQGEHAWTGRLDLPDGRCINVSLPPRQLDAIRKSGPRVLTVRGAVIGDPSDHTEIAFLEIDGRRVGLGVCSRFIVVVR